MSTGTTLVLLHFFGSSHREWDGMRLRIAGKRPVLAIDLAGFGDAADRAPRDVNGMADDVEQAIVDASLTSCVLVGHSMSAKVAAILAARRPAWLRGLVLVTASPPSAEPMDDDARDELLAFDGSRDAAARYIDGMTASRLPDAAREVAIVDAMRVSSNAWQAWVVHGSQEDCTEAVGVLGLPTLVVAGAQDPSLGEQVQRQLVLPHCPQAAFAVIDGGHALPFENPDDLYQEIETFVSGLDHSTQEDA